MYHTTYFQSLHSTTLDRLDTYLRVYHFSISISYTALRFSIGTGTIIWPKFSIIWRHIESSIINNRSLWKLLKHHSLRLAGPHPWLISSLTPPQSTCTARPRLKKWLIFHRQIFFAFQQVRPNICALHTTASTLAHNGRKQKKIAHIFVYTLYRDAFDK